MVYFQLLLSISNIAPQLEEHLVYPNIIIILSFFEDANNRAVYCRTRFIYYGVLNSVLYWLKIASYF